MRPEHIQANHLCDIALDNDRVAYRAKLDQIKAEHGEDIARHAAHQARIQIQMTRDYRYFSWRAEWLKQ